MATHFDWPALVPFDAQPPARFPARALPGALCAYVEHIAEAYQVPPDLPGCLSLGMLSACIAKRVEIQLAPDWREPGNLYYAVVLPSGQRKSAVFRELSRSIEQAERILNEGSADPSANRLLVDDITPEQLAIVLSKNGGRIALMSPEGGLFETMAGRYGNGVPNLDVYLKGYSGDPIRVDRRDGTAEIIPDPALSMVLAIQPDVLEAVARKPFMRGRGMLARFLYALPDARLGSRKVTPDPIDPTIRLAYDDRIKRLLARPQAAADGHAPIILALDREAREQFNAFRETIELRLAPGQDLECIADWTSKLPGAVARIAAAMHCFNDSEVFRKDIDARTMKAAIELAGYFISHALRAFDAMGQDSVEEGARRILQWISRSGTAIFSERTAFQENRGRFKRMPEVRASLASLEERGYIRRRIDDRPTRGPGRRSGTTYEVNPEFLGNADRITHNSHNPSPVQAKPKFWGIWGL